MRDKKSNTMYGNSNNVKNNNNTVTTQIIKTVTLTTHT